MSLHILSPFLKRNIANNFMLITLTIWKKRIPQKPYNTKFNGDKISKKESYDN